jgi:hypothetical protein
MKSEDTIRGALGVFILGFGGMVSAGEPVLATASQTNLVVVTPVEEPQAVLHNPDMGWVIYENYPIDRKSSLLAIQPDADMADVANVAVLFAWSDVERREGEYDFSQVDVAYEHWKKRGKHIQLRMSTESWLYWNRADPPAGVGVPPFIRERMQPAEIQARTIDGLPYTVVDARNPYYRERLTKFLAAVAAHFSGQRAVTLIDLRGFGVWGEWHSGYRYATLDERRAALSWIMDAYSTAFPDQYLALSFSYDLDAPKARHYDGPNNRYDPAFTKHYEEYLRYSAFDHALTKRNVTLRRDGCGGAVYSNERRLNAEAFRTLNKGPMVCEFFGSYPQAKQNGAEWLQWMIEDGLSLHPNYMNTIGWCDLNFIREQPATIRYGLRNMGYRLVPTRVQFPLALYAGEPVQIKMDWINRGVGRAMQNFELRLLLADSQGKTVACTAGLMDTQKWIKGQNYTVVRDIQFRGMPRGGCQLYLAVIDPRTGRPIGLPLRDGRPDGYYKIASSP